MIALKNPKAFLKDRLSNYKASGVEESEEGLDDEEKRRRAKRRIIDRILAGASDVQTLNGVYFTFRAF
jgi:hypothetical protein